MAAVIPKINPKNNGVNGAKWNRLHIESVVCGVKQVFHVEQIKVVFWGWSV